MARLVSSTKNAVGAKVAFGASVDEAFELRVWNGLHEDGVEAGGAQRGDLARLVALEDRDERHVLEVRRGADGARGLLHRAARDGGVEDDEARALAADRAEDVRFAFEA